MDWLPEGTKHYLAHTVFGFSLYALGRLEKRPTSTILRRIRRVKERCEDPFFKKALDDLRRELQIWSRRKNWKESNLMTHFLGGFSVNDSEIEREGRRILRRLCEADAILAVMPEMKNAVVMRVSKEKKAIRTAITTREMAKIFLLKEWIICTKPGKLLQYKITPTGRKALKRFLASTGSGDDVQSYFSEQHREWGTKRIQDPDDGRVRQCRYNVAESPMLMLARRKTSSGAPFLSDELVSAGERLREDFEVAQLGPRVTQNWDRFLSGPSQGDLGGATLGQGAELAGIRAATALNAVGPGLRDILLRCCCHLEGLEAAERNLGWSARSGKIVLKIALEQLAQHYAHAQNPTKNHKARHKEMA